MLNKNVLAPVTFIALIFISNVALSAEPLAGLSHALHATLANHPAIKGQEAEVDAQRFMINSNKAARYPTVSLQADTLDDEFTQSVVRLQQPLWTFGRINTAIAQAEASHSVELLSLQQVQRELIGQTAAAYAKVAGIHQRQQVATENVTQHQELYDSIVRRESGQLATKADTQLANSRLIQAHALETRVMGELQVALAELQSLTQVHVASDKPIEPSLVELPVLADVETLALLNSAQISLQKEKVNAVKLDVEKAKMSNRPTLSFRVEHSFSDSFIDNDDTRAGLAFESSFEGLGLKTSGRVKSAVAKTESAQYQLDATMIEEQRKIKSLMLNRGMQHNLILAQEQAVTALTLTLQSFLRQYENGLKSWVEVLNIQRELTQLRVELAQMETEKLVLSLQVATLIGKLDAVAGISAL